MHKIATGTIALLACVLLVPALPAPIGSEARASAGCETACLATYTAARTACHSMSSSCEKRCVRETDTYSEERACKRECKSDESDCLDGCSLIFSVCKMACD